MTGGGATGRHHRHRRPAADADGARAEPCRIWWVTTADGVAVATRRSGRPDAPVAVVIAHGFSMTSTDRRLAALAARLADAGRAVYTFDFRGHGQSGGASTLGDLETADLEAVVRDARQNGHDRLVVVGASMGGFVALRHAALLGGADAVIAISTPAMWGVSPRLRARALGVAVRSRVGRRLLSVRGTRVDHRSPPPPASPADLAPQITIPVAIVHGDRDPYVPTADAVLLHERLGGYRRLVILPGFWHAETGYTPDFAMLLDALVEELLSSHSSRN
jgi:pimeloyl-ACP methyl ester carboxylesterase